MADEFEIPAPVYRVPRPRGGVDASTSRLLVIAAGLGGTLLLVLGLSLVGGHHHGTVPVIEAESTPVRVKPDKPGGLAVAGQDDEILSSAAGAEAGKLAPAAEAPALQALRAQERDEAAHAAAATAAPARPSSPAEGPPPARPAQAASIPAAAPVSAMPEQKAPPVVPHPAASGTHATEAAAAGHATEVQLGALVSEAAARQEWARLSHKAPDLFAARQPAISQLDHNGQVLWRLRTGGFADVAEATQFCQRARAKGLLCSIAAF